MYATRSNLAWPILAAVCVVGISLSTLAAEDDSAPATQNGKGTPAAVDLQKPIKGLSADQQQQALEFARAQHPELAELLEKLRESSPQEYGKALQDLYRAQQRLSRMAEQNPERFAIEVQLWKVQSRIRLLIAQMVMEGDTAHDDNLKALLSERRNLKIQLVQFERGRAIERLASLDQQLEQLQHDPEGTTEKELAKLKQTVGKQAKATRAIRANVKAKGAVSADQKPRSKTKSKDKAKPDAEADSPKADTPQDQ